MRNPDDIFKSPLRPYFIQHFKERKQSLQVSTYLHQISHLKAFDSYLLNVNYKERDIIDEKLITGWLHSLENITMQTKTQYINSVRMFLKFYSITANVHVYMPPNYHVDDPYVPYYFTDDDICDIYQKIDNYSGNKPEKCKYFKLEFPTIIRLLDSCGLRIEETCEIELTDVDLRNGIIKLRNTKGSRERQVPLSESMLDVLVRYCDAMNFTDSPTGKFLFPRDAPDVHILAADVRDQFRDILKEIGIYDKNRISSTRGPCLHCFRHRFVLKAIKYLLSIGISIDDVNPYLSVFLGHNSLHETEKYMKFASDLFPEEMEKFYETSEDIIPDDDIWDDWM